MAYKYDPNEDPILKDIDRMLEERRAARQQRMAIPAYTPEPPPTPTSRTFGETLGDTALSVGRGLAGGVEGLAGLAGMVPGVNVVADPIREAASDFSTSLRQQMSPLAQQNIADLQKAISEREYGQALTTALRPSNIVEGLAQLGGSMLGAKGIDKLGRATGLYSKLGVPAYEAGVAMTPQMQKALALRAGISEGAFASGAGAGAIADYQQQQGDEGWYGWNPERLYSIPAGLLTGAIGGASARWLPDMDIAVLAGRQAAANMLRQGMTNPQTLLGRIGMGALKEGALEEFPQSMGEGFFQALGTTGQPDMGQITAESLVSALYGGIGGGGFAAFNAPNAPPNTVPEQFASLMETPPGGSVLNAMNPQTAEQREALLAALQQRPIPPTVLQMLGGLSGASGANAALQMPPTAPITPPDYLDQEYSSIIQRDFVPPLTPPQPGGIPLGPSGLQEEDTAVRNMARIGDSNTLTSLKEEYDNLEAVKQDATAALQEAIGWEQFLKPRGAIATPEYTSYMQRVEMLRNALSMATAEQQRVLQDISNIQKNFGAMPTPPSAPVGTQEDPRLIARDQRLWRLPGRIAETKRELAAHEAQLNDPARYALLAATPGGAEWYKAKRAELTASIARDQLALEALRLRGRKKPNYVKALGGLSGNAVANAELQMPPEAAATPPAPAPEAAATVVTPPAPEAAATPPAPGAVVTPPASEAAATPEVVVTPPAPKGTKAKKASTTKELAKETQEAQKALATAEANPTAENWSAVSKAAQAAMTVLTPTGGKAGRPTKSLSVAREINERANKELNKLKETAVNPPQPSSQEAAAVTPEQGTAAAAPSPAPVSTKESPKPSTTTTGSTTTAQSTTGQTRAAPTTEKGGSTSPTEASSEAQSPSATEDELSVKKSKDLNTSPKAKTLSAYLDEQPKPEDGEDINAAVPTMLASIKATIEEIDDLSKGYGLGKAHIWTGDKYKTKYGVSSAYTEDQWYANVSEDLYNAYAKLNDEFSDLESALDVDGNGKALIRAAQQYNKRNAEDGKQTQSALMFSRFYALYAQSALTPDLITGTTYRPENAQNVTYPVKPKSKEANGIPTKNTRFGEILTGDTLPKPKKEEHKNQRAEILGNTEAWLAARPDAVQPASEDEITTHAAVPFFLRHVLTKEFNVFTKLLAESLYEVLRVNNGLYAISVKYYPGLATHPTNKASRASYDPKTNTINVYGAQVSTNEMLHEILHAATLGYLANNFNNKNSNAVKALRALATDLAITISTLDAAKRKALNKDFVELTALFMKEYSKGDGVSEETALRYTSEFVTHALTDRGVNSLMKNSRMNKASSEAVGVIGKLKTLYSGFITAIKYLFGRVKGIEAFSNTQLDGFLSSYGELLNEITAAKTATPTADVFAQKKIKHELYSTADYAEGIALEEELLSQRREAEASRLRDREERARQAAAQAKGTTPQTQRALTETDTAVTVIDNLQQLKARIDAYRHVDALGKFMLGFIPNRLATKERQENLTKQLHKFFSSHPALGRVAINIVDKFMLPANVVSNMHNKNAAVNYIDNLANLIAQDTPLSELEALQQQGWDYLNDPKKKPSDWRITHLIDAFNEVINEAKDYGLVDPALKNAPTADIITYLMDKHYPYTRGYKYGQAGKELFSRHNGEEETILGYLVGVDPNDPSPVLTGWVKKSIVDGKSVITKQFVDSKLSVEKQRAAIEGLYGKGYVQQPYRYYKIRDNTVFRFKTPEENKKVAGHTFLLRSIAATAQEFQHALAGSKFSDEFIAENADDVVPNIADKQIVLNTEENVATLKKLYGDDRVVEYDKARGKDDKALLRTPGTWVVLKGRKWGKLDDYVIPGQIYSALEDLNRNEPFIDSKTIRTLNRWWKKNMTVYSLTASVNNVLSSFVWSYYHDIPPANIKWALEVIYYTKYKPNSAKAEHIAALKEASKMGALFGTLSFSEDLAGLMEAQMNALGNTEDTRTGHFQTAAAMAGPLLAKIKATGKDWDQKASDFYANQDNVFRLAAYRTYVERIAADKGKLTVADLEEAGKKAADSMINYDINAKWVNKMRQSFWPFLAWPYRAMPMIAKIAVEKPWKLLNTLAAVAVLDALAYSLMGNAEPDDDKEERERNLLPPHMRSSIWGLNVAPGFVRLPFGDEGKGVFLGLSRMIPLGDLAVINEGAIVPQTAMPGGPLILALQALGGYDWFRQERIREEGQTWGDNMKNTLGFLWRGGGPASLVRGAETLDKLANDKRGPLGSEANAAVEIARLLGFSVREVDFAESAYNLSKAEKALKQKIKASMRKAVNAELRYGVPDLDAINSIYDEYGAFYNEARVGE